MNLTLSSQAKIAFCVAASLFLTCSYQHVCAADTHDAPYMGRVTTASETSLSVTNKRLGDKKFALSSDTKVTNAKGESVAKTELKEGLNVLVKPAAAGDQAESVKILGVNKEFADKQAKEKAK